MKKIRTINNISPLGTQILIERGLAVGPDITDPDGILVRSADLNDMHFQLHYPVYPDRL